MHSWPPVQAVSTCRRGPDSEQVVCGAHALLLDDRTLKHLIFYRRCRAVLWHDAPPLGERNALLEEAWAAGEEPKKDLTR
jgi:hypothetical protein